MNINDMIANVAAKGGNQSVASAGGGDYTPPPGGVTGARLVGYYEVGQHQGEYKGAPKVNNTVKLVFELIGAKHPPKEVDGQKIPTRLTMTMNLSTNEKAGFYKLFSRLRTEETHMVQLLGKPVLLEVKHAVRGEGASKRTYANIDRDSVRKPTYQQLNPATQELEDKVLEVGPALTPLGMFVWDFATPEMWDSIFIAGEWEERKDDKGTVIAPAKSKNVLQAEIASALNFKALPCYDYASKKITREDSETLDAAVGDVANTPSSDVPEGDPLAGIQ